MASILVAEDDAAVREFVGRALALAGHRVTAVEDGVEALDRIAREPYNLVLADIVMPRLDGIALALKLARDAPDLPVLLMTGYAAERQRAYNLELIVRRVLLKPFSLGELSAAVDDALNRFPPPPRGAARPAARP